MRARTRVSTRTLAHTRRHCAPPARTFGADATHLGRRYNADASLKVPPGTCRWGQLAYCCFFHAAGDNLTKLGPDTPSAQFGAKGVWTSGSVVPTAAVARGVGAAAAAGPTKQELEISACVHPADRTRSDPSLAVCPLMVPRQGGVVSVDGIHPVSCAEGLWCC